MYRNIYFDFYVNPRLLILIEYKVEYTNWFIMGKCQLGIIKKNIKHLDPDVRW